MIETLHIYTRVSTSTQEEHGTSLETQKEMGIQKAQELGFDYKIWNEGGASSNDDTLDNRPELSKLLNQVQADKIKHLWVYNNDRLSRNKTVSFVVTKLLQEHKVTLYTKSGCFDLGDNVQSFMKDIMDIVAVLDNSDRAQKTRIGKLHRVKQGKWHGGPAPFGYKIENKKLVIDDNQAAWVRKIYDWYLKEKPIKWIQQQLEDAGVLTNRGKRSWTIGSIDRILQNTHHNGTYTFTDKHANETVQITCERIVSEKTWEKSQDKRKKRSEKSKLNNRTKNFYMLGGLLRCGHCGHLMRGRIKDSKNERLYYCAQKEKEWKHEHIKQKDKWSRDRGCSMKRSLNIDATNDLVWKKVFSKFFLSDYAKQSIKEDLMKEIYGEDNENDVKKLKARANTLEKYLNEIKDRIADVETRKLLADDEINERVLVNLYKRKMVAEQEVIDLKKVLEEKSVAIEESELESYVGQACELIANSVYSKPIITHDYRKKEFLGKVINEIKVYHDNDNEHTLVITTKVPVLQNSKDLNLTLKKNERNSMNAPLNLNTPKRNKTTTVE